MPTLLTNFRLMRPLSLRNFKLSKIENMNVLQISREVNVTISTEYAGRSSMDFSTLNHLTLRNNVTQWLTAVLIKNISSLCLNILPRKKSYLEIFNFWFLSFVCLGVFRPTQEFFTTITDERLQILTCAGHLWPLSSEGSLACHNYYYTGHPFIMVTSEDLWHSHLLPSVWQRSSPDMF